MASTVASFLGGRRVLRESVTSDLQLAALVRAGLPAGSLDHVLDELSPSVAPQADIYRVVGNARTLQRKRTAKTRLSPDESDRLARLARIVLRTEAALGSTPAAHHWLARPNRALAGKTPLSLLDSDAGSLAVEQVLGRIEHGVYS
ncbi:MAG TPA: antitoxin Xre/MbcA/ParS toxin-binding domain-containing protein [Gemmatimonadales bacterium]|jgi:putative toxin-antitoxin system antitoxin component (TIGR02293 family)